MTFNSPSILLFLSLVAIILINVFSGINLGILSFLAALCLGVYSLHLSPEEVLRFFPGSLFLTLFSVTALFTLAERNGTLTFVLRKFLKFSRGGNKTIVPLFFILSLVLSSLGAGNIAATALLAAPAMGIAQLRKIDPTLMALMVVNGANAGALSPTAPAGIITNGSLASMGYTNLSFSLFFTNLASNALIALLAFIVLKGWKEDARVVTESSNLVVPEEPSNVTFAQIATLVALVVVAALALFATVPLSLSALIGVVFLLFLDKSKNQNIFPLLPWETILMVCGMVTFVSLLEKSGGMVALTSWVLSFTNTQTIHGALAFFAGLLSIFSSSTGVVLPAFLPLLPGLLEGLPEASFVGMATSIVVGSHAVDISPYSTLGALCIAAVVNQEMRKKMYSKMLNWGFAMALVSALICYFVFGVVSV